MRTPSVYPIPDLVGTPANQCLGQVFPRRSLPGHNEPAERTSLNPEQMGQRFLVNQATLIRLLLEGRPSRFPGRTDVTALGNPSSAGRCRWGHAR